MTRWIDGWIDDNLSDGVLQYEGRKEFSESRYFPLPVRSSQLIISTSVSIEYKHRP